MSETLDIYPTVRYIQLAPQRFEGFWDGWQLYVIICNSVHEFLYTIGFIKVLACCRLSVIQASEKHAVTQQYRYSHTNDRGIG
jgi:hypothetical protein